MDSWANFSELEKPQYGRYLQKVRGSALIGRKAGLTGVFRARERLPDCRRICARDLPLYTGVSIIRSVLVIGNVLMVLLDSRGC